MDKMDLLLMWILSLLAFLQSVTLSDLNARYHMLNAEIGSLCSGWTTAQCRREIPNILVHNEVECALACTKNWRCKSFNYKSLPSSSHGSHRCELTPARNYTIRPDVRKSKGYKYYYNAT